MKRASDQLPCDVRGRVLWGRIPGFIEFFKTEGPQRTSQELRHLIEDRYHYLPTLSQVENLRRGLEIRMDPAVRRRAIDARDLAVEVATEKIPSFVRELGPKDEGYFTHVQSPVVISSDWHTPYTDMDLVRKLIQVSERLQVKQLVINGDFFTQDAFSRWPHHRFNVPWPEEKRSARELIQLLFKHFDCIYFILDNHDRRLLVTQEQKHGGLDESDVIELLMFGARQGKLRASVDYHYVLIDKIWRVTSPREYRRVKLSLANRLAQLHHQNIIVGGDHLYGLGLDDSGQHVIASDMCMVERTQVPYAMVSDSSFPMWNKGFYVIINSVLYPFCDHPSLIDWVYWTQHAVPPKKERM